MEIQKKTAGGLNLVSGESELLEKRIIFITGEITEKTVIDFFEKISVLKQRDEKEKITVVINSCGGEIDSGLAICDMIEGAGNTITICMGKAFSAAALILASGKKRYALTHSRTMIHKPHFEGGIDGRLENLQSAQALLAERNECMCRYLAEKCGKTYEEVEKAVEFDHYFSGEDSVEFGIIDDVLSFENFRKEIS